MARHNQKHRRTTGSSSRRALTLVLLLLPLTGLAGKQFISEPAPDFALKNAQGENLRLSEYRGEVVMLTFWASWCGRCRDQLAQLANLHSRHGEAGLRILSVTIDDDPDRARAIMADLRLGFPVLFDADKTVARLYDPRTMPLTVIIDHAGTVRHLHEGYRRGDEESYQSELMALLAE